MESVWLLEPSPQMTDPPDIVSSSKMQHLLHFLSFLHPMTSRVKQKFAFVESFFSLFDIL